MDSSKSGPSLQTLPNELIQSILYFTSSGDLINFQLTSKRFQALGDEPLLWRYFCRTEYKNWEDVAIAKAFAYHSNISNETSQQLDWKQILKQRHTCDHAVRETLDKVLECQQGRIGHVGRIIDMGYDAKDMLLEQSRTPESASDVLARRHWSKVALGAIHRKHAIEAWNSDSSFEDALGAYDMFVIGTRDGDLRQIRSILDRLAENIKTHFEDFASYTIRRKATAIATYLREQNMVGIANDDDYHALRNSFLSLALTSPDHEALPLTSVVIYCCVAQRLGLDALPCDFPMHVHAVVAAPNGKKLDGGSQPDDAPIDRMFMDPFRRNNEVPVDNLKSILRQVGASSTSFEYFLQPCTVRDMVLRQGRNILNSVHMVEEAGLPPTAWASMHPSTDDAFYGALWGMTMSDNSMRQRNYIPHIIRQIQESYPMDVPLLKSYVISSFQDQPFYSRIVDYVEDIEERDNVAKPVIRRDIVGQNVKYRVGQIFRHRTYEYEAMIIGWDQECRMREDWIAQMHVDSLPRGRFQSFYHVLAFDKSRRYVAEENVNAIKTEPSEPVLMLAGQYFKRWERETGRFISNIKDEYPDD